MVLAARTAKKLDAAEQEIEALGLGTRVSEGGHRYSRSGPVPGAGRSDRCRHSVASMCCSTAPMIRAAFEPIDEANMDGWRRAMDVNFFGTMH